MPVETHKFEQLLLDMIKHGEDEEKNPGCKMSWHGIPQQQHEIGNQQGNPQVSQQSSQQILYHHDHSCNHSTKEGQAHATNSHLRLRIVKVCYKQDTAYLDPDQQALTMTAPQKDARANLSQETIAAQAPAKTAPGVENLGPNSPTVSVNNDGQQPHSVFQRTSHHPSHGNIDVKPDHENMDFMEPTLPRLGILRVMLYKDEEHVTTLVCAAQVIHNTEPIQNDKDDRKEPGETQASTCTSGVEDFHQIAAIMGLDLELNETNVRKVLFVSSIYHPYLEIENVVSVYQDITTTFPSTCIQKFLALQSDSEQPVMAWREPTTTLSKEAVTYCYGDHYGKSTMDTGEQPQSVTFSPEIGEAVTTKITDSSASSPRVYDQGAHQHQPHPLDQDVTPHCHHQQRGRKEAPADNGYLKVHEIKLDEVKGTAYFAVGQYVGAAPDETIPESQRGSLHCDALWATHYQGLTHQQHGWVLPIDIGGGSLRAELAGRTPDRGRRACREGGAVAAGRRR